MGFSSPRIYLHLVSVDYQSSTGASLDWFVLGYLRRFCCRCTSLDATARCMGDDSGFRGLYCAFVTRPLDRSESHDERPSWKESLQPIYRQVFVCMMIRRSTASNSPLIASNCLPSDRCHSFLDRSGLYPNRAR